MFVVLQGIDHKNVRGDLMKKMRDLYKLRKKQERQ